MLPDEVYKRRHYGTPQSVLLIMTNYIVFGVAASIFATCNPISWVFYAIMGLLAIYNFINIRKDREEYNRARIIGYVISVVILIGMFVLLKIKAQNCLA